MLVLPYEGRQGECALLNIQMEVNLHLAENKKVQVIWTVTKLGSKFNIKNDTKKEYQHDLIYSVKFSLESCEESCNDEIGRRSAERVSDHSGRDKSSRIYKHSIEKDHPTVKLQEFENFSKGFPRRKL